MGNMSCYDGAYAVSDNLDLMILKYAKTIPCSLGLPISMSVFVGQEFDGLNDVSNFI